MQQSEEQWRRLQDALAAGQGMPPRQAATVIACVLRDLARFHAAGAVHGAVDPAHVLLADDRAKLADAGADAAAPAFQAPERHAGQPASARSDVFSAGTLLYLLLTGRSPFDGPPPSVRNRVTSMIPPAPSAVDAKVPAGLDAVVERAMAKKPEDRFATVQDFARALGEALAAAPPPPPRPAPPPPAGDDATVIRRPADDATVFQPVPPADATVFQPVAPADATVVRPPAPKPGPAPSAPPPQGEGGRGKALMMAVVGLVVVAFLAAVLWLTMG